MALLCADRAGRDGDSPCNAVFTWRTAHRMTCEQLVELVTDYLEGALSDEERERFEEHIELCPMCRVHLDRMRGLIHQLGGLHQRDIDSQVLAEIQARFAGWHSRR
jgi:predicted anti-sigma-YlaC factor YlaD